MYDLFILVKQNGNTLEHDSIVFKAKSHIYFSLCVSFQSERHKVAIIAIINMTRRPNSELQTLAAVT